MNIQLSSGRLYIGDKYVADVHDAEISKVSLGDTDIDYDKKRFPIRNNLIQSVIFDCSNVRLDPVFALYIRHETERFQKKKELLKPKWIHCPFHRGVFIEFSDSTQRYWRIF